MQRFIHVLVRPCRVARKRIVVVAVVVVVVVRHVRVFAFEPNKWIWRRENSLQIVLRSIVVRVLYYEIRKSKVARRMYRLCIVALNQPIGEKK